MRREGRILATLTAMGAISLALCGTASAILPDDQYSMTQPTTELVMPFDATADRASFLIVSNTNATSPAAPQITTHWIFWSKSCKELADVFMCLTLNDTVVVDPRNVQALGPNNEAVGPIVNLDGEQGLVTVVAYWTNETCKPSVSVFAEQAIVGTFTIADTEVGSAFGNDAFGLFTNEANTSVQLPDGSDVNRFAIQTLDPTRVDDTLVILSELREFEGIVVPQSSAQKYFATFYDNLESATSLPDVSVGCPAFRRMIGGEDPLIPDFITVASSGIVSLDPSPNLGDTTYLFGVIGQAVGTFGVSSRVKEDRCELIGEPSCNGV